MITQIQELMPDESNDIRLNLETVITAEGSPGLSENQILGTVLTSAYATKNPRLIELLLKGMETILSAEEMRAAKAASIIMAMNNVYYRAIHLAEESELMKMPARLRMNVIGRPGIPKVDFEVYCTAASAINGCGMCIKAHIHELKKAGLGHDAVQSTLRIAAVINATAQAMSLDAKSYN